MPPDPRWQEDARKIAEALRRKMRERGLTYEVVGERAGMGRDYLRQVLRGTLKLRVEHVLAILAALELSPIDFFTEFYGPPAALPSSSAGEDPSFRTTARILHRSLLRQMIWKLREKGVFSTQEAERMFEELDQSIRVTEPPLP